MLFVSTHPAEIPARPAITVCSLGVVAYADAWELQREQVRRRSAGQVGDALLLLEHPHTYTCGRSTRPEHVLLTPDALQRHQIAMYDVDRGGDVTYHGPGQLVGYPILKLSRYGADLVGYLRKLEDVLIQVVQAFGVQAARLPGLTGVWVGERKIAAIGVKLSASGVTMHGFALNVCPDLRFFEYIVPCGIHNRGVTSLEQVLGCCPPRAQVEQQIARAFSAVFGAVVDLPDGPAYEVHDA
jgi:lipoyl(octanoyl) transferase